MKHKNRLYFSLSVLYLALFDSVATLANGGPKYWQTHVYTDELNPVGSYFLNLGPYAYIGFIIVYLLIAFILIYKLPLKWAFVIGLLYWIGHTIGFMSQGPYWVWSLLKSDYNTIVYIFALFSVASVAVLIWGSLQLFSKRLKLVKR